MHTWPHVPQLFTSLVVSAQPVRQHVCPGVHDGPPAHPVGTHVVPMHVVPGMHIAPHRPQSALLFVRLVSQPFEALPSQLPQPGRHAPIVHMLPAHAGRAFGNPGHRLPHAPQLFGSDVVFAQPVGQHICPGAHAGPPLQPGDTHTPDTHA
jgi:hypothetical protein